MNRYESYLAERDYRRLYEYYLIHVFKFELNIELYPNRNIIYFIKEDSFFKKHSSLDSSEFMMLIVSFLEEKIGQTSIPLIARETKHRNDREKFNFKNKIETSLVDCYGKNWREYLKRELLKKFGVI